MTLLLTSVLSIDVLLYLLDPIVAREHKQTKSSAQTIQLLALRPTINEHNSYAHSLIHMRLQIQDPGSSSTTSQQQANSNLHLGVEDNHD